MQSYKVSKEIKGENEEFGGKHVTMSHECNYLSVLGKSANSVTFPPISDLPHVFMIPYSVVFDPLDPRNSEDGGIPGGPIWMIWMMLMLLSPLMPLTTHWSICPSSFIRCTPTQ